MKTINVTIVKKNRKYFACEINGFSAKLIIDSASQHLEPGIHDLLVEDKSVRTKWGTDVIYQLVGENKDPKKIVTLKHAIYNEMLLEECRKLGGKWDSASETWVFSYLVEKEVEDLDVLYNDDIVDIEIEACQDFGSWHAPVRFLGYTIAQAYGRDSGARLGEGVCQISGKIGSGGSVKNWGTNVSEGSVFRLSVSRNLIEAKRALAEKDSDGDPKWKITIIGE